MKLEQMFELLKLIDGVVNEGLRIKDYYFDDNTVIVRTEDESINFFFYIERSQNK